jgi:hypothetical protein
MAKDIPLEEMEALLLAHIAVTEDTMRELAVQRGVAVRDYLASKQLPPDRLFLGQVKTGAASAKPSGNPAGNPASAIQVEGRPVVEGGASTGSAKWTPLAELNLAAQ